MTRTAGLSIDLLENYMAKAKQPIVPLETVLDVLRANPTPLSIDSLCNELNQRNTGEPYDKHKLHQRIHSLVFYGRIKAERDTIDQRMRWYSVPDTGAVMVMVGFVSHATEDLIKSRGGNLVRVSGGMSSLRAELDKYVTEGGAA